MTPVLQVQGLGAGMHKCREDIPYTQGVGGALGAAGKQAPCLLPEVLGTAADRVGKGDYAQRGSSLQLE